MGLRICSLASGSKGNCCYVSDGRTDILIDLGISALRAEKCLSVLGVDADGVNVLVTHSHTDHVGGLKIFCKRHVGARIHCQKESANAVEYYSGVEPCVVERAFRVGTLSVTAVPASHDVPCFGYVISDGSKRVAVMTDVGTLNPEQLALFAACDIVMLEANHDIAKLNANPRYTRVLKARISSRYGHLSNADCAAACVGLAGRGVRNFILAHLSEDNNDPSLAVSEVCACLNSSGYFGVNVTAAAQNAMTGVYEIC